MNTQDVFWKSSYLIDYCELIKLKALGINPAFLRDNMLKQYEPDWKLVQQITALAYEVAIREGYSLIGKPKANKTEDPDGGVPITAVEWTVNCRDVYEVIKLTDVFIEEIVDRNLDGELLKYACFSFTAC